MTTSLQPNDTLKHYALMSHVIQRLCSADGHSLSLQQLAELAGMSPSHFQKCFKQYVGVSPKQFQQNIILEKAKLALTSLDIEKPSHHSLEQTSLDLSLSSPSRLHDVFVKIEAQSPGEFKSMGQHLYLKYCAQATVFGPALVVRSQRGLFYLGLHPQPLASIDALKNLYPKAIFEQQPDNSLLDFDPFHYPLGSQPPIELHVCATNFQLQVWKALLRCPSGARLSYQHIAKAIGKQSASRAVGTAIGANPIAFLIPCHRVIRQNGALGGYRWGLEHKQALLSWEQALSQA